MKKFQAGGTLRYTSQGEMQKGFRRGVRYLHKKKKILRSYKKLPTHSIMKKYKLNSFLLLKKR